MHVELHVSISKVIVRDDIRAGDGRLSNGGGTHGDLAGAAVVTKVPIQKARGAQTQVESTLNVVIVTVRVGAVVLVITLHVSSPVVASEDVGRAAGLCPFARVAIRKAKVPRQSVNAWTARDWRQRRESLALACACVTARSAVEFSCPWPGGCGSLGRQSRYSLLTVQPHVPSESSVQEDVVTLQVSSCEGAKQVVITSSWEQMVLHTVRHKYWPQAMHKNSSP